MPARLNHFLLQLVKHCLFALALIFGTAGPATAQEAYGPRIVRLSVVDRDSGQVKKVYLHDRRYFVAGEEGRRYSLRIQNVSAERVMVVLSVDGVNVIDGGTADYNGRGYILKPKEWADINGWRKNQDEVAVFRFAPLPQSYAARTGRPGNVGVIGMAVFPERKRPPVVAAPPPKPRPPVMRPNRDHRETRGNEGSMHDVAMPVPAPPPPPPPPSPVFEPSAPPPPPAPDGVIAPKMASPESRPIIRNDRLGTAHGEIEQDVSPIEPFEKARQMPDSVRVLEYDSVQNLIAAGVIRASEIKGPPQPFPGNKDGRGYVPDPPPEPR